MEINDAKPPIIIPYKMPIAPPSIVALDRPPDDKPLRMRFLWDEKNGVPICGAPIDETIKVTFI